MAEEARVRVSQNGRVAIPASFRKALGINIGDEVLLRIRDDELRITTQQRRIQRAQRRARHYLKPGTSLVDRCWRSGVRPLRMSRIVLDASAILAVVHQEAG